MSVKSPTSASPTATASVLPTTHINEPSHHISSFFNESAPGVSSNLAPSSLHRDPVDVGAVAKTTQPPSEQQQPSITSPVVPRPELCVNGNHSPTGKSSHQQQQQKTTSLNSQQDRASQQCSPFSSPKASNPENLIQLDNLSAVPSTIRLRADSTFSAQDSLRLHMNHLRSRGLEDSRSSSFFNPATRFSTPVRETKHVLLEYDPITRRKVLNTYEILREIGRGEHGKVKLAKDLIHKELVAIKIVNRKSKKERPSLRQRRDSKTPVVNEYERKIKREIAIMKKCRHKHIVSLREVLDDINSHKIYLVLEYLEKGEIKWKKLKSDLQNDEEKICNVDDMVIPCCGMSNSGGGPRQPHHRLSNDDDLLSNEYSPNLTFKQSRKIFRDVLLGLEYLHMQGVVHRDIKPANLLVSANYTVKISDFGVSFASSLNDCEEGHLVNELDLAKTAGTPAFFAPELCHLDVGDVGDADDDAIKSPPIDHRIDIWALGVTLYCLLFGKVPFNADSEFELFNVIANKKLEFPQSIEAFNSPGPVKELEFQLACDLLEQMLQKNPEKRLSIREIKEHPFTLMDLEDDVDSLHDLFNLNNAANGSETTFDFNLNDCDIVTQEEIDNAVIGVGTRIKRSLVRAIRAGGLKDSEIKSKFDGMQVDRLKSGGSSEESSSEYSNFNSGIKLNRLQTNHSVILSEQPLTTPASPLLSHSSSSAAAAAANSTKAHPESSLHYNPHVPSHLSNQVSGQLNSTFSFQNPYSLTVPRENGKSYLHEMIESQSVSTSRRGSAGGVEAPQIETKRNVGGNLYLKNQSLVDTFKEIQEEDDKRRRSSLLSSHLNTSTKSSVSSDLNPASNSNMQYQYQYQNQNQNQNQNSYLEQAKAQVMSQPLKIPPAIVTPIPVPAVRPNYEFINDEIRRIEVHSDEFSPTDNNDDAGGGVGGNGGRADDVQTEFFKATAPRNLGHNENLENSFMSLPLTESFASLDSINDDYLSRKYEEYEAKQHDAKTKFIKMGRRKSSFSEADISGNYHTSDNIRNKFEAFNLSDQMSGNKSPSLKKEKEQGRGQGQVQEEDALVVPATGRPALLSRTSSRSDSYSSFSTDTGSSDEEDEEESDGEDLTLAFHSKLAPANRPPFLSHAHRSKSHDSHIPYLNGHQQRVDDVAPPVIFHTGSPELEDVPSALMIAAPVNNEQRQTSSPTVVRAGIDQMNDSRVKASPDPCVATTFKSKLKPGSSTITAQMPLSPTAAVRKAAIIRNIESSEHRKKSEQQLFRENIFNYQFNNHYKKAPVFSAFPDAVNHLDNDEQAILQTSARKFHANRPAYYRSNSVAVGVLQHTSDGLITDMIEEKMESGNNPRDHNK
ncbi:uncharacterized protein LODBEIA_P50530 [Lodderomyces beijingensis]|uniref:Protein kinase domain-containing protein n=1 Tax=Lodderomyces beijingensis TaxID=1775926 RepID=A0ABP0ZRQ6_9ASCO